MENTYGAHNYKPIPVVISEAEGIWVTDPEGITFDTDNGHLYIVGRPNNLLAHVTTAGTLVRMLDISAANARSRIAPSGRCSSSNTKSLSVHNPLSRVRNVSRPLSQWPRFSASNISREVGAAANSASTA